MAEKEGFEPSIPFWGIHDFQSCALGQLRDFSIQAFSKLEYITPFVLICQDLFFILLKLFYKAMKNPAHIRERDFGASDLTRTGDLLITSEMHYRLCYTSICNASLLYRLYMEMSTTFHFLVRDIAISASKCYNQKNDCHGAWKSERASETCKTLQ